MPERLHRRHLLKGLAAGLGAAALTATGSLVGPNGLPLVAAAADETPRVHPELRDLAAQSPNAPFRVIVQRRNKDTRADFAVTAKGNKRVRELGGGHGFVAEITGKQLTELGKHPAIKHISLDAPLRPTATNLDPSKLLTLYPAAVEATGEWPEATGAGVGVAVVDTGIKPGLADLSKNGTQSRVVAEAKFIASKDTCTDGYGHGTHVAGIIAGNSWWRNTTSLKGKYMGCAPEANLINVRVGDDAGMAYLSDLHDAIEWVIANRITYNIRVLNLSMVSSVAESATTSLLCAVVERAWFSGIFVVVAAGNNGANTLIYPPSNDPFVVTVGASDPMSTSGTTDDTLAPWTSYGVTQDGYSKPDLVAPGRYITSLLLSSTAPIAAGIQERITGNGNYIWLSGTSMSAAIVSGIAAQVFQAKPNWTNDQLKYVMMQTAKKLGSPNYPGQGAGQVNAGNIVNYSGTVNKANQGLPISQQLVGPNGATTYVAGTASSWSSSSWSSSSWSSSSWSSSSWSSSSWSNSKPSSTPRV